MGNCLVCSKKIEDVNLYSLCQEHLQQVGKPEASHCIYVFTRGEKQGKPCNVKTKKFFCCKHFHYLTEYKGNWRAIN